MFPFLLHPHACAHGEGYVCTLVECAFYSAEAEVSGCFSCSYFYVARYSIDVDSKLTYDALSEAISSGYSRIPVFDRESSQCIVGLLFVKDLILVDYHAEGKSVSA